MADGDPVTAIIVGSASGSGTGDGGPAIHNGQIIQTPDHQPNIRAVVISKSEVILIRFANMYLVTLVGLLTASGVTGVIQASDFLHLILKCGGASLAPAGLGLLKDLTTVFGDLERKNPLLTGSV